MQVQHVTLHDLDVAYRTMGTGPLIVLLHGMAGSSTTWRHVMPTLARDFTVVAPDLLGQGESAKPRTDYSPGALACMVRDLMMVLGHDHGTIVGQSYGGGIAMQLAYQFPELCDRLVLVGSGGLGVEVNHLLRALSVPGAEIMLPLGCRPGVRRLVEKIGATMALLGAPPGPASVEVFRSYASLLDPATRSAFMQTLRTVVDYRGQSVSARGKLYLTSELPTLIMWGDADPLIPIQHAYDAHAAIPHSRLEVFPGVGHYPHCEDPDRFVKALVAFMRETPDAAPTTPDRMRELLTRHTSA